MTRGARLAAATDRTLAATVAQGDVAGVVGGVTDRHGTLHEAAAGALERRFDIAYARGDGR